MMNFQLRHNDLPLTDSLKHRRIRYQARRLACAMLASLSLFTLMQYLSSIASDTSPLVVASSDIQQGDALKQSSLQLIQAPQSDVFRQAFTTVGEVENLIARTEISRGQAIYRNAVTTSVETPNGLTKLRVNLASIPSDLHPGDHVTLVTSGSCTESDHGEEASLCTLSEDAQVLNISKDEEDSGLFSSVSTDNPSYNAVEFVLSPQEALAIIARQQEGPILAVDIQ
ncbi:SAF domain-containing protein [Bifidobacterium sp.]|jgi:hypothetical protein|uniref:SAF domain-containing protein n=1 Tax=Bifidobacterium sp. TaxID=41200 RepID=UPI0025BA3A31|nr:SAF domain-containing protein [Bifidobacterium sp.]MCI1635252.1 SAF domain-containing protein [Bifidobacterium sp.]